MKINSILLLFLLIDNLITSAGVGGGAKILEYVIIISQVISVVENLTS